MTHIIITSISHLGQNQFLSLVSGNSRKTYYEQTPMATHFVAAGLLSVISQYDIRFLCMYTGAHCLLSVS